MELAAVGREANDLPEWMLAESLADIYGGAGGERFGENGGIPEQTVKFQQDQLADDDVLAVLERFKKGSRRRVLDIPRFDGRQQSRPRRVISAGDTSRSAAKVFAR